MSVALVASQNLAITRPWWGEYSKIVLRAQVLEIEAVDTCHHCHCQSLDDGDS